MSKYAKYANYVLTGEIAGATPEAAAGEPDVAAAPKLDSATSGLGRASAEEQEEGAGRCDCGGRQYRQTGLMRPNQQHAPTCKLGSASQVAISTTAPTGTRTSATTAHKLCLRESSRPSSELSRTSLLGRPLKVETHHKDLRYRKKQNIIYNFLERPRGYKAAFYHFVL